MKKLYEKPFIRRQSGGVSNKFGGLTQPIVRESIEGVAVADLVREYGSPLFIYCEKKVRQKYEALTDSFSMRYPKVQHAWSYKTNYLQAICTLFHKLGSWAEVVSGMEYEMALKLGVTPSRIIFNGPFKPFAALRKALFDGATVNVDSMDELYDVEKIATETGASVKVGIRVNMSLGTCMAWDRFGFNLEAGQAYQAVKRAISGGRIVIDGLHAHVGTFVLDPEIYRMETEKLVEFSKQIRDDFGIRPRYIDIGGGFPSHNTLKGTYLSTSDMVPEFEKYADNVCGTLLAGFRPDELPLLILETGRALVDEAGVLVATVVAVKRLNDGTRALVLDAGVNLLFTAFWYDHDVIPTVDRGSALEEHIIYGPLCMQIDVIREKMRLPHLEKGDTIIIRPAGAYNNTQWMQFINLRPNVVMISEKGQVGLIREAETVDYLQERERIPAWLKD
jgi:diaminopimelate decarboxylase